MPEFRQKKIAEQAEVYSPNPSSSASDIRIQKRLAECLAKSFPQKIVFAKPSPHCSATCPNTWRAEPQRKMSFPFSRKNSPPPNQKSKRHFSLGLLAYSPVRGAFSVSFILKIGSSLVQIG